MCNDCCPTSIECDEKLVVDLAELSAALLDVVEQGTAADDLDSERLYALAESEVVCFTPVIFANLLADLIRREVELTGRPITQIVGRLRAIAAAGIDGVEESLADNPEDVEP